MFGMEPTATPAPMALTPDQKAAHLTDLNQKFLDAKRRMRQNAEDKSAAELKAKGHGEEIRKINLELIELEKQISAAEKA
jgi:hypothetical protein